ncbi:MAG: hypothetical protein A3K19_02690 [Lentisphaerae bacterium RIFOXYB12_FULL_65_16]|nr:MAG: hypothetical protein A3K18_10130 [Lentisphaerae bacterium RIFOXYA12_64_32]OGV92257.1 MAG: hypothetical protein A3K19_02690 [Lentisphaerae bacterium RIFOXYB12_FULL_65_16]
MPNAGPLLTTAKNDLTTAYNYCRDLTPVPTGDHLNPNGGNLAGLNLAPGLYKFTATALITGGNVTLTGSADDVWIFQIGSNFNVGTGMKVLLAGGARAKNVFWQVTTEATLDTTSVVEGTILAGQSITMNTGSTLNGRALAFTGQVAFGSGPTGGGANLPDHAVATDLDADDSGLTLGADYAKTFTPGSAAVAMSDPLDATVTDSSYPDMVSLTITGDGILDGADEIVTLGGVPYPQNADKSATAIKGATTFRIAFVTLTKVFTITKDGGGRMPIADLNSLLRDMTYQDVKVAPTTGPRTFTAKVNDSVTDSNNAVSTVTVNYPPAIDLDANDSGGTLGADYAKTFAVGGAAVAMSDPLDATVTDSDSTTMTSLTITGDGILDGADEIVTIGGVAYPQNADKSATAIKGATTFRIAFVALTQIFTITKELGGGMPLADLNSLLRDMTYQDVKVAPTTGPRTFTAKVNDGLVESNEAVCTITFAVAPVIDLDANNSGGTLGADYAKTFTQGGAAARMSDQLDATVTDSDSTTMASFTITGGGIVDGADEIVTIGGVAYPQNADKSATAVKGATTFRIAFVTLTKAFAITKDGGGAIPLADLNSLLRDMTYQNTKVGPTAGNRTFACKVNDGLLDSNTATATITVVLTYALTVNAGTGDGAYAAGTAVPVGATIPVGYVFDQWTGEVASLARLANPLLADTIVTAMPAFDVTVTATFTAAPPATFTLVVNYGTGDGAYAAGTTNIPVTATVLPGTVFAAWTGDTAHLASTTLAATTVPLMPSSNIEVTATFTAAPPDTFTLTVVGGTGGGSYEFGEIVDVTAVSFPAGKVFATWTGDIGYLDAVASATTTVTMPGANITIAALFNAEPPWYPRIPWTPVVNYGVNPVADYEWYNLQVWDGEPGAVGVNLVLETNVNRAAITPEEEYLLITSDGLLPDTYSWRYRTWVPETDTYGDWLPAEGGHEQVVDYRNPPVNDTQAPVLPSGLVCTSPNPGPTGNFNLEFLAQNAQGYELKITGGLPQNNLQHRVYFMPGEDRVVPFNVITQRTVTLVGPDTCTWQVRGFNPDSDSAWSTGPNITVTGGTVMPPAEVPDYGHMRPTDGWWVVTESGVGTASIVFEWEPVPGAAGYLMYLASASGAPILNYVDVGNVTHWPADTTSGERVALPPGTYLWCLIAYNGANPREFGGWNHSPRAPDEESPIFFQVIENLKAPTITDAARNGEEDNTVDITWVGSAPATVDVMLFYTGAAGWLEALNQPVTPAGAETGTVPLGRAWGPGTNYLLLTAKTAAGTAGPRSRLFVIP